MNWRGFPRLPDVAERRARAAREVCGSRRAAASSRPVVIDGRTIARTFWGKAWCENLESYSDFENRLPRGRSYLRSGSVLDLQIAPGESRRSCAVRALTKLRSRSNRLPAELEAHQNAMRRQVGSLIELLEGRLSERVMEVVTHRDEGLFPKPAEIQMDCSCPDWAAMCKHVAAASCTASADPTGSAAGAAVQAAQRRPRRVDRAGGRSCGESQRSQSQDPRGRRAGRRIWNRARTDRIDSPGLEATEVTESGQSRRT